MPDADPIYWPLDDLLRAYREGALSPVEVLEGALARIDAFDPKLNAFLARLDDAARAQARAAEQAWRRGDAGPLAGVPISIKDTFPLAGAVTTFGSAVYAGQISPRDSGVVRRLRAAGAVFTGKTNTAEFGQSATTDNRLRDDCRNPWDVARTPGGSSGGAAASVAAGLSSVAIGADGGGSIRIPAAFSGLFGFKPTFGTCRDEDGLRAMSDFVCPGPLAWRASDARRVLEVLAEVALPRSEVSKPLRIAWDPHPEGRAVDPALASVVAEAVEIVASLGHVVERLALPIAGWNDVFAPLVLHDEDRERGHLLDASPGVLTDYEAKTLRAARELRPGDVESARAQHERYRERIDEVFERFDLILIPTTATPAFLLGERPREIDGRDVDWLWGAFPFTSPFNVSGNPAASLPCGLADGLPVGLQLVGRRGADALVLDAAEQFEETLAFDPSAVRRQWSLPATASGVQA